MPRQILELIYGLNYFRLLVFNIFNIDFFIYIFSLFQLFLNIFQVFFSFFIYFPVFFLVWRLCHFFLGFLAFTNNLQFAHLACSKLLFPLPLRNKAICYVYFIASLNSVNLLVPQSKLDVPSFVLCNSGSNPSRPAKLLKFSWLSNIYYIYNKVYISLSYLQILDCHNIKNTSSIYKILYYLTNFPASSNFISLLINFLMVSFKSSIFILICFVVFISLNVTDLSFNVSKTKGF